MHGGLPTSYSLRTITWLITLHVDNITCVWAIQNPMSCFSVRQCQFFYTLRTCWPTPRERIDEIELA